MLERLEKLAGILGACLLFLMMLLTFVDVTGRTLFAHPVTGAGEVTELLLAGMVFLLLPATAGRREHIVVDLIDAIAGPVLDILKDLLTGVLGAVLFGLIGWKLWGLGRKAADYGDSTSSLGIPFEPVFYAMAGLSIIVALLFAAQIVRLPTRRARAESKRSGIEDEAARKPPPSGAAE